MAIWDSPDNDNEDWGSGRTLQWARYQALCFQAMPFLVCICNLNISCHFVSWPPRLNFYRGEFYYLWNLCHAVRAPMGRIQFWGAISYVYVFLVVFIDFINSLIRRLEKNFNITTPPPREKKSHWLKYSSTGLLPLLNYWCFLKKILTHNLIAYFLIHLRSGALNTNPSLLIDSSSRWGEGLMQDV